MLGNGLLSAGSSLGVKGNRRPGILYGRLATGTWVEALAGGELCLPIPMGAVWCSELFVRLPQFCQFCESANFEGYSERYTGEESSISLAVGQFMHSWGELLIGTDSATGQTGKSLHFGMNYFDGRASQRVFP